MPDAPVPDRPRTVLFCAVLVTAPLLEIVEALISPLANGTTAQDIASIAASPGRFATSVVIGTLGTFLLLPALLGLAHRTSARTPRLAFATSIAVGLVAITFVGIRGTQAVQLALATSLPVSKAAAIVDATGSNPIGIEVLVLFLVSNVVGVVLLGIALLRSRRVPVGSVVLLLLFPVLDFVAPGETGVVVSHSVLLAAFVWMAVGFLRSKAARRERATVRAERTPAAALR